MGMDQYDHAKLNATLNGEGAESEDEMQLQDTPTSHLRNALQVIELAGPNWLRPADAFAVRERIEAALVQMNPVGVELICWACGVTFTARTSNQRECIPCYVEGKL